MDDDQPSDSSAAHRPSPPPPGLSRRDALKNLGAGVSAVASGVAAGSSGCMGPDRCAGGPLPVEGTSEAARAQASLLAGIDHLVVVMVENRSFDHLLGALAFDQSYPDRNRVDGLSGDEENMDRSGKMLRIHLRERDIPTNGPGRNWHISRQAFNEGRNDGFARANQAPHDLEAMAYHDRRLAPLHYALADRYTVCDRWFASVMGATWPNRFYLHAATSNGRKTNVDWGPGEPVTVWERMAERCYSAKNYYAGVIAWHSMAFLKRAISGGGALIPDRIETFFRDAREGTLPNFAIIDPDFHLNDLHPPHTLAMGEAFLGSVVRALEQSPQWPRTMLVIVYDENGGFYDHVPPPTTDDPDPEFRQLGFRVPALVIGPQVWQGKVVSTPLEHVSVLSTLRTRFGIDSLGPRMDAAVDLSSCIDPARTSSSEGPRLTDVAPIALPRTMLAACCAWQNSQEEIEHGVRAGLVPEALVDTRTTSERLASWLRPAEELGAVELLQK